MSYFTMLCLTIPCYFLQYHAIAPVKEDHTDRHVLYETEGPFGAGHARLDVVRVTK